jgi:hypothetical protein
LLSGTLRTTTIERYRCEHVRPALPQPRGRLPARVTLGAFRHVSARAGAVTFVALTDLGAVGVLLAVVHVIGRRT